MESGPLRILYRDEHYVAVYKPAGLLMHRSPIDSRATRFLVQTLRNQIGQRVYPVHRLDRPTQGVVVLALDADAACRLQQLFETSEVEKIYLAIVRGWAPADVVVDRALGDPADPRIERGVQSRAAFTAVRRLDTMELPIAAGGHSTVRYSLVECRPRSGRRHQIRRHLKHLRHPIIGDANYGDGFHNRLWRDVLGLAGLLLAATSLRFVHPYSGAAVEISSAVDLPFDAALRLPHWSAETP